MNIKALRRRLGLTQLELAARLAVTPLTVKSWEAGRHTPRAEQLAQLALLFQDHPAPASAPVAPPTRPVLRLGEAVRLMGLKDEGHGRRSDHTLRKALKSGALPGFKAPGYRAAVAEWCFYADDFEVWRAQHYQAHRDPRRRA